MTKFDFRTNPLRERLDAKKPSFGIFVSEFCSPWIGSMINVVGYDFCIIDMEHGAFSLADISSLLAGFQGGTCTPLVRVPAIRREHFGPSLDLGVGVIMVPGVETADDAKACVDFMRYPPLGSRGLSLSRPHTGFMKADRDSFTATSNAKHILIIQIESPRGVENLDEILSVPGVDVAFVGCADLSLTMQIPNDPQKSPLRDILSEVMKTSTRHGIGGGTNITSPELIESLIPLGLQLISCATDTRVFMDGMTQALQPLRQRFCQ